MRALISNDDGYLSPALIQLHSICKKHFQNTEVVAPDRDCSGVSSCLTLRNPLYTYKHTNGFVSVQGTPTDCVHLGLSGLFNESFDIVIAGINLGENLGDDVIYSGTVAAATEGRFLRYPSLAISMNSVEPTHYDTAGNVIDYIINQVKSLHLPSKTILNINIPDIPLSQLQGIKVTRLGSRHPAAAAKKLPNHHGQSSFWIGPQGKIADQSDGTDFHAIKNNFASVTPINSDLTDVDSLSEVGKILRNT